MTWVEHVALMGESRGAYRVWWGNLRERDHFKDPDVDRGIILKWIFKKWGMGASTRLICLEGGTSGSFFQHNNNLWFP